MKIAWASLFFLVSLYSTSVFAEEPKLPDTPFEYKFTCSVHGKTNSCFSLKFSPIPDRDVTARCALYNKEGRKVLGMFPLRKIIHKSKDGTKKIHFVVSCLSNDLIPTATIDLFIRSKDKSKRLKRYNFPFEAVIPKPKQKTTKTKSP